MASRWPWHGDEQAQRTGRSASTLYPVRKAGALRAAAFAAQPLAQHRRRPLGDRSLRRLAPLQRLLLGVVLDEVARLAAELEHRDLALAPIAEAERHHRGADTGAHVDRAGGFVVPTVLRVAARSVKTVHV